MKLFSLYGDLELATLNFNSGVTAAREQMLSLKGEMENLQTESTKTGEILDGAIGHALGDILSGITEAAIETAFTFASEGVGLASSMEEIQNVVDTTFGEATANQINAWARTAKEAYGIGALSAKEYASTMGATLKGMGIQDGKLYEMSTALVGLAGDMASFRNLGTEETFRKIMSGMTGEMEPLRELGIIMNATNLSAHALAMGIEEQWSKLDSATQTQVRYSYLMQQTADMQGDFAKTSESYSNQIRLMQENIEQLKLSMGESLLPVLTELVGWFNSLFGSQEEATQSAEDFGRGLSVSFSDVALTTGQALGLVEALEELSASTEDAASTEMWSAIMTELQTVLPGIGNLIDTTTGQITGGTEALRAYVEQWETSAYELARTTAIKSYYDEYAQMQRNLYDLEIESAINQRMISGMTANVDLALESLMERAVIPYISADYRKEENLAYLRSTEGLQELYDALSMEDLDAVISGTGLTLSSMLDAANAWEQVAQMQTLIGQYETQLENLPTYEADIARAREEISAYEQRLAVLEQIVANQEPPTVVVNVNNSANEDLIVSEVEYRISRDTKNKSFTAVSR